MAVIDAGDSTLVVDRNLDGLSVMTYRSNSPTPARVMLDRDEVIALAEMLLEEAQRMERKRKHKETANVQG